MLTILLLVVSIGDAIQESPSLHLTNMSRSGYKKSNKIHHSVSIALPYQYAVTQRLQIPNKSRSLVDRYTPSNDSMMRQDAQKPTITVLFGGGFAIKAFVAVVLVLFIGSTALWEVGNVYLILLLSFLFACNSAVFIGITTGSYHNCVLAYNETMCFGRNDYGQCGTGDTNNRGDEANEMGDGLSRIDLGTNFIPKEIVAGHLHTCALSINNEVKCFGLNNYGQLGLGDRNNRGDGANEMGDNLPHINLGSNFIPMQIVAGNRYTCALSKNNTVKCFGKNEYGQLGYGDTRSRGDEANEMGNYLPEVDLGADFIPMQITTKYTY
eukprot:968925_1